MRQVSFSMFEEATKRMFEKKMEECGVGKHFHVLVSLFLGPFVFVSDATCTERLNVCT